jgi:uncharacterized cupin superfamily protein
MRPPFIRNVSEVEEAPYEDKPSGIGVLIRDIGAAVGARLAGIDVTTIRPGKRSSAFHHHKHKEEFFFVLEGRCRLRVGDAVHNLLPGDAVSRSAGTGVAHQFFNPYPVPCRVLMLGVMGAKGLTDETVYPELGKKVLVSAAGGRRTVRLRAAGTAAARRRR